MIFYDDGIVVLMIEVTLMAVVVAVMENSPLRPLRFSQIISEFMECLGKLLDEGSLMRMG